LGGDVESPPLLLISFDLLISVTVDGPTVTGVMVDDATLHVAWCCRKN
jgi:hypothetical protein